MGWIIKHDGNVAGRVASFPELTTPAPSAFVSVTLGQKRSVLKSTIRRGAAGDEVRFSPGTFATVPDDVPCEVEPSTGRAYRIFWLTRDPARQRALLGLVIAVAGLVLKLAMDLGKLYPVFIVGNAGIAIATILSSLLTGVGLAITFYGVFSSTE